MNLLTHTNIQNFEYILNYCFFFYLLNISITFNCISEKSIQKKQREVEKLRQELELLLETKRNLKAQVQDTQETQELYSRESIDTQQELELEIPELGQEIIIENDTDTDVENASNDDSFESETKTLGDSTINDLRQKINEYKYMSQELNQLEMENVEIVDLLEQSSKRKLELLFELSIRKKEIKA
ncbi:hypothetical protein HK103_000502 [Boothiomyces macroporosus]|uniref:Uncharacterized protein n=1 Tax=Boothiomyces macroporosus TaxID=261099 RepID=A0AAD5UEN0_9FUNG|nr:hypothetical protein HK103_000502 [Boothiomyces macroporosus]